MDRDDTGVELADLHAVREEAALTVTSFSRDAELTGRPLPGRAFEIVDAQGTYLLTIPFSFALWACPDRDRAEEPTAGLQHAWHGPGLAS